MDVLDYPLAGIGGRQPQVGADLVVEGPGQIRNRKIAVHQGPLQLKAQEDVQVVGHFIGLGADQRRFDFVDGK